MTRSPPPPIEVGAARSPRVLLLAADPRVSLGAFDTGTHVYVCRGLALSAGRPVRDADAAAFLEALGYVRTAAACRAPRPSGTALVVFFDDTGQARWELATVVASEPGGTC